MTASIRWPGGVLGPIAREWGDEVAWEISRALAGREVYISKRESQSDAISHVHALDLVCIEWIRTQFGGGAYYIPAARFQRAVMLYRVELSIHQVAAHLKCSERTARRYRRRAAAEGLL